MILSIIIYNSKFKRTKRTMRATNNLFVEYLPVIDRATYNFFVSLYGSNLPNSVINDNINTYFTQLVNGVMY
jgi:hypothetical protein